MASVIDRVKTLRAETASQAALPTNHSQRRASAFHREWNIYITVRACHCSPRYESHNIQVPPSYLISNNVVYLTIAEKAYPRKLAFSYLDELSKEFDGSYGPKVDEARKPYAFVGFG